MTKNEYTVVVRSDGSRHVCNVITDQGLEYVGRYSTLGAFARACVARRIGCDPAEVSWKII